MHVGLEGGADGEPAVERLAVGGERQDHRPAAATRALQPGAAHDDAVLLDVGAAGDEPSIGHRGEGADVVLAHRPPHRRPHRVGERAGQVDRAPPAAGQQVEQPQLGDDQLVVVGRGGDPRGQAPEPVRQGAGLGVDQPRRHRLPRLGPVQAGVGQAGPHLVGQPAVQLGQAGGDPGGPLGRSPAGVGRRIGPSGRGGLLDAGVVIRLGADPLLLGGTFRHRAR